MKKQHHQQHLFPLVSLLLVLLGIFSIVKSDLEITIWHITVVATLYFAANVSYGLVKKQLTVVKVIEFGLVALLSEYLAMMFLI